MKRLIIFDFDNTLAVTDAFIKVTKPDGRTLKLSPHQYVGYKPDPGDQMDFSDFENLINPRGIKFYNLMLKKIASLCSSCDVVILTARSNEKPVALYLKSLGIVDGVKIVALGSGDPQMKKQFVGKMLNRGYADIVFYDDAEKNIKAVESLRGPYNKENVRIHTHLVPSVRYASL